MRADRARLRRGRGGVGPRLGVSRTASRAAAKKNAKIVSWWQRLKIDAGGAVPVG